MKLRRLGTSDIEISPLGLGCWPFSFELLSGEMAEIEAASRPWR